MIPLSSLNISFASIMPEVLLTGLALLVLVLDFFIREEKSILGYVSVIGLIVLIPISAGTVAAGPSFGGMVMADEFAAYFNVIFLISAILTILISMDYLKKMNVRRGEYYHIILFSTVGMM